MFLLLLRKKHHHFRTSCLHFLPPKHHLTSSPPEPPTFITQYLIDSCGFSPAAAAKASKRISHLTSPDRPDSVRHFLKHNDFTDSDIRAFISRYPRILCTSVERSMAPNLRALSALGFSQPDLRRLVAANPQALQLASAVPCAQFFGSLLRGCTKKLLLALTRNRGLLTLDVDTGIAAKISLLKAHGLTADDIGVLLVRGQGFIVRSVSSIETLLKRAQELGFVPGTPMYIHCLLSLSGLTGEKLKAKMEIYRSLGWSEGELSLALRKHPFVLRLSEENIRRKMEFLVGTAGCTLAYITLRPQLISYSLEKRLIPRHHVLGILKSNELIDRERDFYGFMCITERDFVDDVILPHRDRLPTLLETYTDTCAGKIKL
ncbi:transcription termination factor MTERF8, chloroplastic-like isoform X2 [Iris pallida]|uniref:Transcription termination factor MTERF8, chloroplastic-like isoform X2 n=1 Tax=Iris pallida TaxID=29817 RepID=A0AAX6DJA3_IRIPA|nr:transcription termination factor MTERF8, chloroplastic-like isoform X2 [Iris pallida]